MAATGSNNRLLGNNRFRNVTKNGVNQGRGSILDKMDAVSGCCLLLYYSRDVYGISKISYTHHVRHLRLERLVRGTEGGHVLGVHYFVVRKLNGAI